MTDVRFGNAANAYNAVGKMGTAPSGDTGGETSSSGGVGFEDLLGEALGGAKSSAYKTEAMSAKSMVGKTELPDLVTAITDAELTLNTVVAVRDKIIQAYQDILKMPI